MRNEGLIRFESDDERKAWVTFAHWLGSGVAKNGVRAKILAIIERWLADFLATYERAERLEAELRNLRAAETQRIVPLTRATYLDPDLSH